mgnify:CR=1 FL=1
MYDTIYLDPESWDFALDIDGNIALANAPYATAQDVASACRLWKGEAIYNTTRGIPYGESILGQMIPSNVLSGMYNTESLTVPDVATANSILYYNSANRKLTGQIQLTLANGTTNVINI